MKQTFSLHDVELLGRETCHQGFLRIERHELRHRLFSGGWSVPIVRELCVRGDACVGLVHDPVRDRLVLVEQFRIGALAEPTPWHLDLVAGVIDPGETPAQALVREIGEETGLAVSPAALVPIRRYLPSVGGSSEAIHLFYAPVDLGASTAGSVHGSLHGAASGEDIRLHVVSGAEALELLHTGRLNSAAAIIALSWLASQPSCPP